MTDCDSGNCVHPSRGALCQDGGLFGYCEDPSCGYEESCEFLGRCTCPCHAGVASVAGNPTRIHGANQG